MAKRETLDQLVAAAVEPRRCGRTALQRDVLGVVAGVVAVSADRHVAALLIFEVRETRMWLPTFMCKTSTFNSAVVHTGSRAPLLRTVADMVNNNREVTAAERFYAASGPMATSVMECDARYYRECLMADRGAVTVWLSSGEVEHTAGTRYLDVERVRGDEIDGAVEVIYLGVTLRKYPAGTWTGWVAVDTAEV